MRFKSLIIFSVLLLVSVSVEAQYTPYFQNYVLSEYNAGNQNWDVSKAENGKVYVANNNGLLEYDGLKWNFKELPNKTIIRSVLAYKDRVYTGSYEEFGFWERNLKGEIIYFSLSDSIKEKISQDEEIWQIIIYKDTIVFRSFFSVYMYSPTGEIKKMNPGSIVLACNVINEELYVYIKKGNL
jgi:AraC family transcriptional regulator, chitin signaling transcriptional activator